MLRVSALAVRPRGSSRPFYIAPERVELLKWLGFVAMLVEHVARYALQLDVAGTVYYDIGRLAFPFFALALAGGLSAPGANFTRTWRRLLLWGCVAQLGALLVRAPLPFNVLWTFALAVGLVGVFHLEDTSKWLRAIAIALILAASTAVEFIQGGVIFAACAIWYARRPHGLALVSLVASCGLLCLVSGNLVALGALGLAWLIAQAPFELRRAPGAFYVLYVIQFPLLWVAGRLLA